MQVTKNDMEVKACGTIPFMRMRDRELVALMILRPGGYWEFPKGKKEKGETDVETALRETREETGLVGEIQDEAPIEMSYSFERDGEQYDKSVSYFFCRVPDASTVTVQKEEVNDYAWFPLEDLIERSTYPEMKAVARKVLQALAD